MSQDDKVREVSSRQFSTLSSISPCLIFPVFFFCERVHSVVFIILFQHFIVPTVIVFSCVVPWFFQRKNGLIFKILKFFLLLGRFRSFSHSLLLCILIHILNLLCIVNGFPLTYLPEMVINLWPMFKQNNNKNIKSYTALDSHTTHGKRRWWWWWRWRPADVKRQWDKKKRKTKYAWCWWGWYLFIVDLSIVCHFKN